MKRVFVPIGVLMIITCGFFLSCQQDQYIGQKGTPIGSVDIDGDGTSDGTAIDVNGDGAADGVDTNGDGTIDDSWSDEYKIIDNANDTDTTAPGDIIDLKMTSVGSKDSSQQAIFSWNDPSDSDFSTVSVTVFDWTTGDNWTDSVKKDVETYKLSSINDFDRCTLTFKTGDTAGNLSSGKSFDVYYHADTAVTPTYITSGTDLHTSLTSNLNGYYILDADVDLNGVSWAPVGPFTGVLDGNGHTISNLNTLDISDTNLHDLGLFGVIESNAMVMNLRLKDLAIDISSSNIYRGGSLAGINEGNIANCSATGSIAATSNTQLGGFLGNNSGGAIDRCYASVKVTTASIYAGGFVAQNNIYGTIKNSYATGDVSSTADYLGGFAGESGGSFSYCYSSGPVSTTLSNPSYRGGFCGSYTNSATSYRIYFNSNSDSTLVDKHAVDIDLTNKDSFTGFFDLIPNAWSISSSVNGGMPYITNLQP